MRRAKIVCTLGPAVNTAERILQLAEAGMDVARLNMSHGDQTDHQSNLEFVRAAAAQTGKAIAVLADLQGPKIRLGRFSGGPVTLALGDRFTLPGFHGVVLGDGAVPLSVLERTVTRWRPCRAVR